MSVETAIAPDLSAEPWWHRAACRSRLDLDWIEPSTQEKKRCRAVCASCPVRQQCRRAALIRGEAWGIWGGLDPDERAMIAAEQGFPPPTVLPAHGTNTRYAKHRCPCSPCRQAHADYERHRREQTRRTSHDDEVSTVPVQAEASRAARATA